MELRTAVKLRIWVIYLLYDKIINKTCLPHCSCQFASCMICNAGCCKVVDVVILVLWPLWPLCHRIEYHSLLSLWITSVVVVCILVYHLSARVTPPASTWLNINFLYTHRVAFGVSPIKLRSRVSKNEITSWTLEIFVIEFTVT